MDRREKHVNAKLEEDLPRYQNRIGIEDPKIWFGLDEAGHRNARNVRDLARALRRRDFAEAELCLDLIGRDDHCFQEQVALGRQAA